MIRWLIDWFLASWSEKIKDTNPKKLQVYEAGVQVPQPDPPHISPNPILRISPFPDAPHHPSSRDLHPVGRVLQGESLRSEAQHWKVMEGNFSDREQSSEDKDEGLTKELPLYHWVNRGFDPL